MTTTVDAAQADAPPTAVATVPEPSGDPAAPPRKRSRFRLAARLASGLVAVGLLYFGLWWDARVGSGWVTVLLVTAIALPCVVEFFRFVDHLQLDGRPLEAKPFRWLAYVCAGLLPAATEWDCLRHGLPDLGGFGAADGLIGLALVGSCLLQLTRKRIDGAMVNVALTVLAVGYCAWLPTFFVRLRHLELPGAAGGLGWEYQGVEFVIMGIFVAKNADVGALLIGSMYGKTKLIPRLSPGKTWEGALGGLAFSVGLIALCMVTQPLLALGSLGWGGALGLAGLMWLSALSGDLVESAFKRDCCQKDSGSKVPGFGGMLDLVDSLMVAGPVMYAYLLLFGASNH